MILVCKEISKNSKQSMFKKLNPQSLIMYYLINMLFKKAKCKGCLKHKSMAVFYYKVDEGLKVTCEKLQD